MVVYRPDGPCVVVVVMVYRPDGPVCGGGGGIQT